MEPHIKSEKRGALGLLTLNRPQALNALTHGMVTALKHQLDAWGADADIQAVAICGEGRGFCAGGDIRAVQHAVMAGTDAGARLLHDEYHLNAAISAFPKPFIALLHGPVMGGGAGLSVHGSLRLADATLDFAMPETAIGFIPDVGSSHFLSRLPGGLGLYLALTGARIGLGDALAAGLVSHAVESADFAAVIAALARGGSAADAITPFIRKPPPAALAPHRRRIETIFTAASVEAILERLDREGGDFAQATARTIRRMSPTSLKLTYRLLGEAADLDLKSCLMMEYRVASRLIAMPDFREGVRAALVDKDRAPKWNPASLAGVGALDGLFAPLRDELF